MGKKFLYIYILCMSLILSSCKKDFLERKPRDLISEIDAYGSQSGVEALTVKLYNDMLLEDFGYTVAEDAGYLSTTTDEAVRSYTWNASVINGPVVGNWFGNWDYGKIRRVNDFLEKVGTANINESLMKRFTAEARFIRAFHYFGLVKRYGGVPLVTKTQQYTVGDDASKLIVQRSTEQEIWDFIASELEVCITDLSDPVTGANQNRVNKYAALALKSRAMLYAASIAKYGTVQINGLVGIPQNLADKYWQLSLDASNKIINDGKYSLYNTGGDKSENFQNLFLTPNNSEAIYSKIYKTPEVGHSFDYFNMPHSFRVGWGSAINPTLNMVEEFEYIDGTPGKLKINDENGKAIVYNKPLDLFLNKDPRLSATIMLPSSDWQGGQLEVRRGIINGTNKIVSESLTQGYPTDGADFKIVGKDGVTTTGDPTKTGFYIKKFLSPTGRVESGRSNTPWMVFRLGEIYLNQAEAAFELNKVGEALTAINKIRDRAGIKLLTSVTLDQIRHERKIELAFENHRLWDIRRWRIATTVLNNLVLRALYPYAIWQAGAPTNTLKYSFEDVPVKTPRTFPEKLYYEPVPQGTPIFVQNPLY